MKTKNGFISILASFIILAIGFGIAYQYSQKLKNNIQDDVISISQKVDNYQLAGSVIYQKNGGTGTSTASWTGLIRIATGTWSTTTINGADIKITGTTTQGDILYYNGTLWTNLTYGASGYYLKTQGIGANPIWSAPPGEAVIGAATSTTLRNSNDEEKLSASQTYAKIKEIKLNQDLAAVRLIYDYRSDYTDYQMWANVYVNGVATGTEVTEKLGVWASSTKDICCLLSGDLIQIYGHTTSTGPGKADIRNVRLYYNRLITGFGSEVLDTSLVIGAASTTNQDP